MNITPIAATGILQTSTIAQVGIQPVVTLIDTAPATTSTSAQLVDISSLGLLLSAASSFSSGTTGNATGNANSGFAQLAAATERFVQVFNDFQSSSYSNLQNPSGEPIDSLFLQALNSQAGSGATLLSRLSGIGITYQPPSTANPSGALTVDFAKLQSAYNLDQSGTTALFAAATQALGLAAAAFATPLQQIELLNPAAATTSSQTDLETTAEQTNPLLAATAEEATEISAALQSSLATEALTEALTAATTVAATPAATPVATAPLAATATAPALQATVTTQPTGAGAAARAPEALIENAIATEATVPEIVAAAQLTVTQSLIGTTQANASVLPALLTPANPQPSITIGETIATAQLAAVQLLTGTAQPTVSELLVSIAPANQAATPTAPTTAETTATAQLTAAQLLAATETAMPEAAAQVANAAAPAPTLPAAATVAAATPAVATLAPIASATTLAATAQLAAPAAAAVAAAATAATAETATAPAAATPSNLNSPLFSATDPITAEALAAYHLVDGVLAPAIRRTEAIAAADYNEIGVIAKVGQARLDLHE